MDFIINAHSDKLSSLYGSLWACRKCGKVSLFALDE
jgi:hypothetical protein